MTFVCPYGRFIYFRRFEAHSDGMCARTCLCVSHEAFIILEYYQPRRMRCLASLQQPVASSLVGLSVPVHRLRLQSPSPIDLSCSGILNPRVERATICRYLWLRRRRRRCCYKIKTSNAMQIRTAWNATNIKNGVLTSGIGHIKPRPAHNRLFCTTFRSNTTLYLTTLWCTYVTCLVSTFSDVVNNQHCIIDFFHPISSSTKRF